MSAVEQLTGLKTGEATGEPRTGISVPAGETATVEAEKNEGRDYVVLKRITGSSPGSPQKWEFIVNITANSTEQAVRRAAEAPGTSFLNTDGPTTLVAIPVRSFNPLTLTVKTETTITVS